MIKYYNWQKYNQSRYLTAQKILSYNKKKKFNFLEDGQYSHIHDVYALSLMLLKKKKEIRVLDFGGGTGVANFNLINKINIKNITFVIYDPYFSTTQRHSEINFKKYNLKVEYTNNLKNIKKSSFDFLYFGSSIQYINNLYDILDKINISKIKYILISNSFMSLKKTFIVEQLKKRLLNQKIHSFSQLINFFSKRNFKLVFKSLITNIDKVIKKKYYNEIILGNFLFEKQ